MPADPNHCPYCGYDLRGVYASWESTCPLRMTCSECGHEFDVGELLRRGSTLTSILVRRAVAIEWVILAVVLVMLVLFAYVIISMFLSRP